MADYAVHFEIRKGLGPDTFPKTIFVGIDDIQPEWSESDMKAIAVEEAERQLRNSEDYRLYGKNWTVYAISTT